MMSHSTLPRPANGRPRCRQPGRFVDSCTITAYLGAASEAYLPDLDEARPCKSAC